MSDDISDIADFYNRNPQLEHIRLEKNQLEYELTWQFLEKYLPTEGNILEIGAATGRYTLELAKRGYTILALDLSQANIEFCRKQLEQEGLSESVQCMVADSRDLNSVPGLNFDAVLMMGPLYHLVLESDRKLALNAAYHRLRTGGIIFSTFISRYGIFGELIKKIPEWIERHEDIKSLLVRGRQSENSPRSGFRGYFATVSEIAPLHESIGFKTIKLVAVEPAISADDESYNKLEGERRKLWLDLYYKISAEPSIIGASRHLLYIGKK